MNQKFRQQMFGVEYAAYTSLAGKASSQQGRKCNRTDWNSRFSGSIYLPLDPDLGAPTEVESKYPRTDSDEPSEGSNASGQRYGTFRSWIMKRPQNRPENVIFFWRFQVHFGNRNAVHYVDDMAKQSWIPGWKRYTERYRPTRIRVSTRTNLDCDRDENQSVSEETSAELANRSPRPQFRVVRRAPMNRLNAIEPKIDVREAREDAPGTFGALPFISLQAAYLKHRQLVCASRKWVVEKKSEAGENNGGRGT
ncbi:hypothetical protein C8R44DRAFT_747066 [Mycena epipterygia]|nr:hypothetical protein C8R44DRAFT_747066 [Mycena epipterygia]